MFASTPQVNHLVMKTSGLYMEEEEHTHYGFGENGFEVYVNTFQLKQMINEISQL